MSIHLVGAAASWELELGLMFQALQVVLIACTILSLCSISRLASNLKPWPSTLVRSCLILVIRAPVASVSQPPCKWRL